MKKFSLIILCVLLFGEISYSQNLIRVNNNPGIDADYSTLQDANDNASNGDTIYVEGSEAYYAGGDITKTVTIIGPGYFLSENPETQASPIETRFNGDIVFKTGSEGSIITGCNIDFKNVVIEADDVSVIGCNIREVHISSNVEYILILKNYIINRIQAAGIPSPEITNSIIANNIVGEQIWIPNLNSSVQVVNNVIQGNGGYNFPIDCYNSIIQNNIITNSIGVVGVNTGNTIKNNIMASDGTNSNGNQYNIDMSTVFADFGGSLDYSTDAKWKLKEGSPAIGAGIDGVDCGAYGGVNPYVLSGLPDLPRIYDASVPASTNTGEGLKVTIKVKSGQ